MNLLLLLLFTLFSSAIGVSVTPTDIPDKSDKMVSKSDAPQQVAAEKQTQSNSESADGDKKAAQKSFGGNPWNNVAYSNFWPWYGFGKGWYPSGWYPSYLPLYSGHGGYYGGGGGHGGWYKGW